MRGSAFFIYDKNRNNDVTISITISHTTILLIVFVSTNTVPMHSTALA